MGHLSAMGSSRPTLRWPSVLLLLLTHLSLVLTACSGEALCCLEYETMNVDDICSAWLDAGLTCDSHWYDGCSEDHPRGVEFNAFQLFSLGCSQCGGGGGDSAACATSFDDVDALCAVWIAEGFTCDTKWSDACSTDNPAGPEYNDYTLGQSACSQCVGACGESGDGYTLALSGAADCTGCGEPILTYEACATAAALRAAAMGVGGLGSSESWDGPPGCHVQDGFNFQFNSNMDGGAWEDHTPICAADAVGACGGEALCCLEYETMSADDVCSAWLDAGFTCDTRWSDVCSEDHPAGAEFNAFQLVSSRCSQCGGGGGGGGGTRGDPITNFQGVETRYYLSMRRFTPVLEQGSYVVSQLAGPMNPPPGLEAHRGAWVVATEVNVAGLDSIRIETVDPTTLLLAHPNATAPPATTDALTTMRLSVGGKQRAVGAHTLSMLATTVTASRVKGPGLQELKIGNGFVERIDIQAPGLHLRITSAKANKFADEQHQVLGLHLDVEFLTFDQSAVRGALPEMWGLQPMTENTKLLLDQKNIDN